MKPFLIPIIILLIMLASCRKQSWNLSSPNENVKVYVSNKNDHAIFNLSFNGQQILLHSPVGLELEGIDFTRNVQLSDFTEKTVDEMWETVNGKTRTVRNHYNEYLFKVTQPGMSYNVLFRIYDKGFAYRYIFSEAAKINSEKTRLNFVSDYDMYAYNNEKHNIGPVKRSENKLETVQYPLIMKFESGKYAAIHEAEILEFAPFVINTNGDGFSLSFNINYSLRKKAFKTSWRAILFGDKIGDLVESNLLVNLNEPCKISDPSWIKPGKALWDWRVWGYLAPDGFKYGLNTVSHKRMIDFAAQNNIQNLLIDADWYGSEFSEESDPTSAREGIVIEECMNYAQKKNIGIILYLNDIGAKKFGLEQVLKQFHDWGAVGIKYGFMKGTGEEKVKHTRRVVELCAKYKLMVDFHDNPIPPSGDRRTWPNLVTKEFGHAQSDAKYSHCPETSVNQVLINQISGPLDYTNGWFDLNNSTVRPKVFEVIPGTIAAEVAKLITIYTGWMVLPDAPEAYLKHDEMFDAVRNMPAQFDDFKILDAQLDEYVSVLRKAGSDWWIGSLTNSNSRKVKINLDFLEPGKTYKATLYEDAEDTHFKNNKEVYRVREMDVNSTSVISAEMAPGGGHSIWIREGYK